MAPRMNPAETSAFAGGRFGSRIREVFPDGEWREGARTAFRGIGALREGILAGPGKKAVKNPESVFAKEFASMIIWSFGSGVAALDCGVCILAPEAVLGLGGITAVITSRIKDEESGRIVSFKDSIDPLNAAIFGLIDHRGLVSPLAFSASIMLVHAGMRNTMLMPYGLKTDFARLFPETLSADSFY
ncbi:MAG: hypothetical protein V1827_06000 [Candidatus Micrarchaeota archaeon]